jgi:hypothetical protein
MLLLAGEASATAEGPGTYYVSAPKTNEHLGPSAATIVTNTIYRQQRVDVFEVRDGWARVSKFYDGAVEGVSGRVARWVLAEHLDRKSPADLPQPKLGNDPRIQGLPKVGENGLTERDVRVLYSGARHFLKTGKCSRVEFGDKSLGRENTYYINCGGPQNLFFTPADVPSS